MSYETHIKRENTFSITRTFWSAALAAPLCFAALPALAGPAAEPAKDMQSQAQTEPAESMTKKAPPLPEPTQKPDMQMPEGAEQMMEDAPTEPATPPISIITREPETATGIATNDMAEGEKCYPQEDGSVECICEGEEACADLVTSGVCEPGTYWGGKSTSTSESSNMGGCTKKSATP